MPKVEITSQSFDNEKDNIDLTLGKISTSIEHNKHCLSNQVMLDDYLHMMVMVETIKCNLLSLPLAKINNTEIAYIKTKERLMEYVNSYIEIIDKSETPLKKTANNEKH